MKIELVVSEDIILKKLSKSDIPNIFRMIDQEREYLSKWLPFVDSTQEESDTEMYVNSVLNTPEEQQDQVFIIYYKSSFAGMIGLKGADKINHKVELGYWLSEKLQKNGIVIRSVKILMDYAFQELEMNRIRIRCAVGNLRSSGIPRKLGFRLEGIERAGEKTADGSYADIEVYSMLKKDW